MVLVVKKGTCLFSRRKSFWAGRPAGCSPPTLGPAGPGLACTFTLAAPTRCPLLPPHSYPHLRCVCIWYVVCICMCLYMRVCFIMVCMSPFKARRCYVSLMIKGVHAGYTSVWNYIIWMKWCLSISTLRPAAYVLQICTGSISVRFFLSLFCHLSSLPLDLGVQTGMTGLDKHDFGKDTGTTGLMTMLVCSTWPEFVETDGPWFDDITWEGTRGW